MRPVVKLGGGLVLLVGVSLVAYLLFARPTEQPPAAPTAPRPGRVVSLGRLAPRGEVINLSAPSGDRLARLIATEGQDVKAGDIVAYLDSHPERLAEHKRIAAQLEEAQARLAAETAYATAQIAEAQARLRQLEALPGLEVQAQEARVQMLERELENARRELERTTSLRAKELVAQQDLDRQALVAHRDEMELAAARALLDKLRQAHTLDVRLAQAQLRTAQAGLVRAQRSTEVESLREALVSAAARLERSVLRAPVNGQILKLVSRAGEETGGRSILQMGDVAQMYAIAEVYETDVGRVRPAQRATITSPALGQALGGHVEHVGRAISRNLVVDVDPAAATDRRVAEVRIRLDDSRSAAKLVNLQVTVVIDVGGP